VEVELHPLFTSFTPPVSAAHSVNACPHLKSQSVHPARSLPLLTELFPLTNSPGQPDINCTCRSNAQRPAHCDQQRIQSASIRTVRHCIALSALCPNPPEKYVQISSLPCMPHVPPISSSILPLQQFVAGSANQASARNDICSTVLLLPYFLPFRRPYLPQQHLPNLPRLSSSLQAPQPLNTVSQI
jgi:hypothetical protein